MLFCIAATWGCSESEMVSPDDAATPDDSTSLVDTTDLKAKDSSQAEDKSDSSSVVDTVTTVDVDSTVSDSTADSTNVDVVIESNIDYSYPAGSPVALNGHLRVEGVNLVNQNGEKYQLRGMSSHGLQWFPEYINGTLMDTLSHWGANVIRLAMYVNEGGYADGTESEKQSFKEDIDSYVELAGRRGLYVIIDWHILDNQQGGGNPWSEIEASEEFWGYMSKKHANKAHVIFEIANEPSPKGVFWEFDGEKNDIKEYAEFIIPIIRENDKANSIVIVGTPDWSGTLSAVKNSPLDIKNVMYAKHFYAGSHSVGGLSSVADIIPVFVSEWGTSNYSGDGGDDYENAQVWLDLMKQKNISWCNWSLASKSESSAFFKSGAPPMGPYSEHLSISGQFIKFKLQNPDKIFVAQIPYDLYVSVTSDEGTEIVIHPKKEQYMYGDEIKLYYEKNSNEQFYGWYWWDESGLQESMKDTLRLTLNDTYNETDISALFRTVGNYISNGNFNYTTSGWTPNSTSDDKKSYSVSAVDGVCVIYGEYDTVHTTSIKKYTQGIIAGEKYLLSFDVKSPDVDTVEIMSFGYDDASNSEIFMTEKIAILPEFKTIAVEYLPPTSSSQFVIGFTAQSGTVYIDNVKVTLQ